MCAVSFRAWRPIWLTAQQLQGWSHVDLSAADMRSRYQVLSSPSSRKRPLVGLVLWACLSALVCQVKAVLYLAKGQLSSRPLVSTYSCFPASQVCSWLGGLCVQPKHRDMTILGNFFLRVNGITHSVLLCLLLMVPVWACSLVKFPQMTDEPGVFPGYDIAERLGWLTLLV